MASPDEAAPATGAAESGAAAVEAILSRYRQFAFPQGEDAVADVVKITYSQKGEMWSAPGAKPMAFKADQWTDARTSAFRWVRGHMLDSVSLTTVLGVLALVLRFLPQPEVQ